MTTITVTLGSICSGGNHLTMNITGAHTASVVMDIALVSAPLDQSEIEAFVKTIMKMAKGGRTLAQARTLLQAGVTVTI